MARKIRFPLKMKNGAEVRTLDELKENFDLESVLGYFADGKLTTWLVDRYYDEKAAAVSALSADMPDLNAKLCEILEVEYQPDNDTADLEYIQRRNEKFRIISAFTDDKDILNNIDLVALNQNDLFDILDEGPKTVYLYGEKFSIPFGKKNICYIGVNNPIILIDKSKYVFEYTEEGIVFRNVRYDESVNPYITRGELLYLENKYTEAFPLVEKAADSGNPRAMYILARFYSHGFNTVKIDRHKRNALCQRASEYNEPLSMHGYAHWCLKDGSDEQKKVYSLISNKIELLSVTKDIIAQSLLGNMYENGHGVRRDYSKALDWYRKAAEQGYACAQCNLGYMYNNGYGVEQDYSEAVEWYRKAAEQGYANAQNNLGNCYYNGNGIGQDYSKAVEWYRKAAEQGYADAQCNLGHMYQYGHGVGQDYSEAVEWYRKAVEQGYAHAQYCLGYMYDNGQGVGQDYSKAIEWYKKAAANGSIAAENCLGLKSIRNTMAEVNSILKSWRYK